MTPQTLTIVGTCDRKLFGLAPGERLRRQLRNMPQARVVASASAVLSDATVAWLLDNPGVVLTSPAGRPLAVALPDGDAPEGALDDARYRTANPAQLPDQFVRKLRRRDTLLARSLDEEPVVGVERAVFGNVYKGVTDLVTKWAWPLPAFWVTRGLSRVGVSPNMVTSVGLVLTFLAAWLFYRGELGWGLAAAWTMTFLDTVDGKLARSTVTSSRFGNLLDHATDYIHPPIWWLCLAYGIAGRQPAVTDNAGAISDLVWTSCWLILGTYVLGRAVEELFKSRLGFNQYLWRRFDSLFRLVVSRRNVILLIMTIGLIAGAPAQAYAVCAGWSVVSVLIQAVRLAQGAAAARRGPLRSWLM